MNEVRKSKIKEFKFHQFVIRYWASGSGKTYVGIARVPFKDANSDWDEGIETIKIYENTEEAERVVLSSMKNILVRFCEENGIKLE